MEPLEKLCHDGPVEQSGIRRKINAATGSVLAAATIELRNDGFVLGQFAMEKEVSKTETSRSKE